jgi:hypothetical protein
MKKNLVANYIHGAIYNALKIRRSIVIDLGKGVVVRGYLSRACRTEDGVYDLEISIDEQPRLRKRCDRPTWELG